MVKELEKPPLGVVATTCTRFADGDDEEEEVMIAEVKENSLGHNSGLRVGDRVKVWNNLTRGDSHLIFTREDIWKGYTDAAVGDEIQLHVLDKNETEHTVLLQLGTAAPKPELLVTGLKVEGCSSAIEHAHLAVELHIQDSSVSETTAFQPCGSTGDPTVWLSTTTINLLPCTKPVVNLVVTLLAKTATDNTLVTVAEKLFPLSNLVVDVPSTWTLTMDLEKTIPFKFECPPTVVIDLLPKGFGRSIKDLVQRQAGEISHLKKNVYNLQHELQATQGTLAPLEEKLKNSALHGQASDSMRDGLRVQLKIEQEEGTKLRARADRDRATITNLQQELAQLKNRALRGDIGSSGGGGGTEGLPPPVPTGMHDRKEPVIQAELSSMKETVQSLQHKVRLLTDQALVTREDVLHQTLEKVQEEGTLESSYGKMRAELEIANATLIWEQTNNDRLQKKLHTVEKDNQGMQIDNLELTETLHKQKDAIRLLEYKYNNIEKQYADEAVVLKKQLELETAELERITMEWEKDTTQRVQLQNQIQELLAELQCMQQDTAQLKIQLLDEEATSANLQYQFNQAKANLQQAEQKIRKMQDQSLNDVDDEDPPCTKPFSNTTPFTTQQWNELLQRATTAEHTVAKLQSELQETTKQQQDAVAPISKAHSTMTTYHNSRTSDLQTKLEKVQQQNRCLQKLVDSHHTSHSTNNLMGLLQQNDKLVEENEQLQSSLQELQEWRQNTEVERLKAQPVQQLLQFQSQLTRIETEHLETVKEKNKLITLNSELQKKVGEMAFKLSGLEHSEGKSSAHTPKDASSPKTRTVGTNYYFDDMQLQIARLLQFQQTSTGQINSLQRQLSEKDKVMKHLQDQLLQMEHVLSDENDLRMKIKYELDSKTIQLRKCKKQNASLEAEIDALNSQNNSLVLAHSSCGQPDFTINPVGPIIDSNTSSPDKSDNTYNISDVSYNETFNLSTSQNEEVRLTQSLISTISNSKQHHNHNSGYSDKTQPALSSLPPLNVYLRPSQVGTSSNNSTAVPPTVPTAIDSGHTTTGGGGSVGGATDMSASSVRLSEGSVPVAAAGSSGGCGSGVTVVAPSTITHLVSTLPTQLHQSPQTTTATPAQTQRTVPPATSINGGTTQRNDASVVTILAETNTSPTTLPATCPAEEDNAGELTLQCAPRDIHHCDTHHQSVSATRSNQVQRQQPPHYLTTTTPQHHNTPRIAHMGDRILQSQLNVLQTQVTEPTPPPSKDTTFNSMDSMHLLEISGELLYVAEAGGNLNNKTNSPIRSIINKDILPPPITTTQHQGTSFQQGGSVGGTNGLCSTGGGSCTSSSSAFTQQVSGSVSSSREGSTSQTSNSNGSEGGTPYPQPPPTGGTQNGRSRSVLLRSSALEMMGCGNTRSVHRSNSADAVSRAPLNSKQRTQSRSPSQQRPHTDRQHTHSTSISSRRHSSPANREPPLQKWHPVKGQSSVSITAAAPGPNRPSIHGYPSPHRSPHMVFSPGNIPPKTRIPHSTPNGGRFPVPTTPAGCSRTGGPPPPTKPAYSYSSNWL